MSEELFELRNYFHLGNFAAALQEGTTMAVDDPAAKIEKDVIMARLNIAMGKADTVISNVTDDSPMGLQAVKLYAMYAKDPSNSTIVLETLKVWLEDPSCNANPSLLLMTGIIYSEEKDFDSALRFANKGGTLEHQALKVQIFINMDRVDVAQKELELMKREDEYATLTQLCVAWVNLALGGSNVEEALYAFQELLERHGATEILLNGVALCQMYMKRYDEAERTLQEALNKNHTHADTLANSITCASYKKKPAELVVNYMNGLKAAAPSSHPWLEAADSFKSKFDAAAAAVGSS